MANKHHTAEQIIAKLREAEVFLSKSLRMPEVCRKLGVTEQARHHLTGSPLADLIRGCQRSAPAYSL